jgi:hypothetical protein
MLLNTRRQSHEQSFNPKRSDRSSHANCTGGRMGISLTMKNRFKKGLIGLLAVVGGILGFADTSKAAIGRLDVENRIENTFYDSQFVELIQMPGASDGKDSNDSIYTYMGGTSSKIISHVEGHPLEEQGELDIDAKSEGSFAPFYLELGVIGQGAKKGDLITIDSPNQVWLRMPRALSKGYDFGNKTITLQQHDSDLSDPNTFPVYDVRKEIAYGNDMGKGYNEFVLPLPYLGTVGSEIPYAYFRVDFDRNLADFDNNGIVDLKDFAFLASEWGKTGNSFADIAISDPANAIYLSPNTTPYFDGVVDLSDLVKFSESWLVTYRFKAPAPIEGTSNE